MFGRIVHFGGNGFFFPAPRCDLAGEALGCDVLQQRFRGKRFGHAPCANCDKEARFFLFRGFSFANGFSRNRVSGGRIPRDNNRMYQDQPTPLLFWGKGYSGFELHRRWINCNCREKKTQTTVAAVPDTYRGKYKKGEENVAEKYAASVKEAISRLESRGMEKNTEHSVVKSVFLCRSSVRGLHCRDHTRLRGPNRLSRGVSLDIN